LRLRAVQKWAAKFRAGWETVENDERPGRPTQNDLGYAVLSFLEKQPYSSSWKVSKALYSPKTTILRVLDDPGLSFFALR
jgi:hypothetical protein